MKLRNRLVFKIVNLCNTVFIITIIILDGYLFFGTYSRTTADIKRSLVNRVEKEANGIYGNLFSKIEVLTAGYAGLLGTLELFDEGDLEKISRLLINENGMIAGGGYWLEYNTLPDRKFYGPYWFREGGELKLTWDYSNEENDYTKNDWYRNDGLSSGKKVVWSELYTDTVTNIPMITATAAIMKDGRKAGVVTLDVGLKELSDHFSSIKVTEVSDCALSLVTQKGVCVTNGGRDEAGTKLYDFDLTGEGGGIETVGNRFVFFTPIGDTGLLITLDVTRHAIVAPITSTLIVNILIALFCILLSILLITYMVHRMVTVPLDRTIATLKEVFDGETTDLTKRLAWKTKDELGEMVGYFNYALQKMAELISSIMRQSEALSKSGENLSANMTETAASVNQISANILSVKKQAVNQSASVAQTDAAMRQIASGIRQLNENIDQQSDSVSQSSSAIEEMLANIASVTQNLSKNTENVGELAAASERGSSDLSTVSASMKDVAQESEGLLAISEVIQSIASQTNLLAMNAAIEAAHAGEAGKGFAVVSDEIRKLAESSGEQARTVTEVLQKIKEAMVKTTASAQEVLHQFEDINRRISEVSEREQEVQAAMEEQGKGSRNVLEAINHLSQLTGKVKSSSQEMLSGSSEVITESGNLARITVEVSGSMNEMSEGITQINIAMTDVNALCQDNKESVEVLVREVGKFRIG